MSWRFTVVDSPRRPPHKKYSLSNHEVGAVEPCSVSPKNGGYAFFFSNFARFDSRSETLSLHVHVFYKKLGSGHSTKSFLILNEMLSIIVLKVS